MARPRCSWLALFANKLFALFANKRERRAETSSGCGGQSRRSLAVIASVGATSDAVDHNRGGSHGGGRPGDGRWSDHCGTAHASSG